MKPLGEAYFQWNMQFNDDAEDVEGDLEIKPRGVAAVMQKEVRTQRLTSLLQTVSNPMLAPFVKMPNLMRELAIAQDIDPDSLVNDVNEAQVYAQMLQGMMQMLNKQQAQKLAALLHSKEWPQMEEYLADLREVTIQAVVMAQSESELRQTQGKLALLEMLLKLKSSHEAVVRKMMAKRTYTPDEYQSQFADFYNMGGIDVAVAGQQGKSTKRRQTNPSVNECFDACVGTITVNLRVCLVRFRLRWIRATVWD